MAKLLLTVYSGLGKDSRGKDLQAPLVPPLMDDALEIGDQVAESEPFPAESTLLMLKPIGGSAAVAFNGKAPDPRFHIIEPGEVRFYSVAPRMQVKVIAAGDIL